MSGGATHLRLEVISGNGAGDTILVEDELIIGRHATGAGRLSEDEEISRQHARISREVTGDYAIEDLGSSNGTFVNGLRIQTPRLLEPGDSIETGTTTLLVTEGDPDAVTEAPVVAARPMSPNAASLAPVGSIDRSIGPTPALALKLEVDLDAREARIALEGAGDTVRVVYEHGRWRIDPAVPGPSR